MKFLVSAGEASGDMYAAGVVSRLMQLAPESSFYGCAGPKLQQLGVSPIVDSASLAVVGLAEVAGHLPRIYRDFRKLVRFAREHRPDAAILTDSPDFNLRLAAQLKKMRVPVFYLVAPQVWAWRQGRVKTIRQLVDCLYCLFPFEERWFRERGVNAFYIGHPLVGTVRTTCSRSEFFERHSLREDAKTIAVLPGSRAGEVIRHLPVLLDVIERLRSRFELNVLLASPKGFYSEQVLGRFREPLNRLSIKVLEGETWDCIGHSELALAASGTVTIEAAILNTPMVTFYRVTALSWWAGRWMIKAPFLSMVNLVAGRRIVPELIQTDMTAAGIAEEAADLLTNDERSEQMRSDLRTVSSALKPEGDPFGRVADSIWQSCCSGVRSEYVDAVASGRE